MTKFRNTLIKLTEETKSTFLKAPTCKDQNQLKTLIPILNLRERFKTNNLLKICIAPAKSMMTSMVNFSKDRILKQAEVEMKSNCVRINHSYETSLNSRFKNKCM